MSETSKYNYLNKIYKVFIEQFNILAVKTDDINEAFIIFETLNARGKDLETADLLKNHLFRISDSKIDDIKEEWKIMLSKLGKIDPTTYIRHYWNSQNNFLREKDLYKIMRKNITSPKKCLELVKDLSFLAEVYSNLVNPREESYFSNDINKKLIILKDLSAKNFYPILLALTKQNFEDKEILKILSVLEVLVVRNFVVAQKVANIYELEFSKIAFKISQEKLIKTDDIIQEINKWIVSDDDFKQAFSTFEIKNKSAIRYILKMIDSSISLVVPEMKIIDDNAIVNIEHILPVDYSLWKDVTIDFHDEYLWRLGNLSLLGSEFNKKCSNYPFEQKKEIYKQSSIEITKKILNYNNWTEKEINERQKYFANIAVSIWKK